MMPRRVLAFLLLAGGFTGAGFAQAPAASGFAFDTALARRYFREAAELTSRDAAVLWGRSLGGPILFVDPRSRALLADTADPEGQLRPAGAFYSGLLPASENAANAPIRWASRSWAMVLWPPPADSLARAVLLAHELWHRLQDSLGLPARDPPNPHLGSRDGRLWLRLEARALRQALTALPPARPRALRDALLFRRARRHRFPAADSSERQLELNEGLAEYTGIALATADTALRRTLVAARLLTLDSATHYERSFAYQTGPAYGFFLDALAPGWCTALRPGDDLAYRLEVAIAAPAGVRTATAVARAGSYGYAAVRRAETTRAAEQQARLAGLRRRFVSGPALELPLAEMKLGFDPGKVEALDSLGTIYGSLRLTDRWGVLQTDASGGLISADWRRLVVPAPAPEVTTGRRLAGPGWVLELSPGWRLVRGRRPGDWTLTRGDQ